MRRDGDWVYDGTFRYPAASERVRWAKTREILERTAPGPYEDGNYIAMLAHQAAAIELSVSQWSRYEARAEDLLGRVIIGTTVEPRSQGMTTAVAGCSVIEMSAGMVDLLYQSAKAIVLAWKRNDPGTEGRLSFSTRPEDTDALLDRDPYATELLFDTLAAWLYDGRHRASYSTVPAPEYRAPLKLLINGAERFVLAHEYGHALMDQLASEAGEQLTSWEREVRADTFASVAVMQSSRELDLLPPDMALQGAVVAMQAHDLLAAAVQTARFGREIGSQSSPTHPSFDTRLKALESVFLQSSGDDATSREHLPAMLFPARTLDQLKHRITPLLRAQHRARRTMHPIWRAA